jgi:hypothetical protein
MTSEMDERTDEPDEIGQLLRGALPRRPAPARLRVAVLEEFNPPESRRRPAFWLPPALAALAAAMVMVLWLAPALPRPGVDPMQILSSAGISEYARAVWGDVRPDIVPGSLPRVMEESGVILNWVFVGDEEIQLVGALPTVFDGRRAMALVYRDREGHTVSYIIALGPNVIIPERGRVQIERWRPLIRKDNGFSVILWRQSGLVCVLVSDLVSERDLGRFKQYFVKVRSATELSRSY